MDSTQMIGFRGEPALIQLHAVWQYVRYIFFFLNPAQKIVVVFLTLTGNQTLLVCFIPWSDARCLNTRQNSMWKYCCTAYSPTLATIGLHLTYMCMTFIYVLFWLQLTSCACPVSKLRAAEYHLLVCSLALNCGSLGRMGMLFWHLSALFALTLNKSGPKRQRSDTHLRSLFKKGLLYNLAWMYK